MCGICGIMHEDPAALVDERRLRAMNNAMMHRGPDDEGLWVGGAVGLAMRRLSVIDLFRGHQPMRNDEGTVTVVFNGEIYNFQAVREALERRGHTFKTLCDTEVILHGYEEYGDEAVLHFNGMFAFAVYDASQRRLLLARDRLGEKPLYYTRNHGAILFASELNALLRSGYVQPKLNPPALDAYFTYLYIPSPDTIFQDVYELRPGHTLVFERGSAKVEPYWKATFAPEASWTLDSAAEAYAALLEDSVRLRRVSDVPLGAFLSGGLDSSTVVGLLSRSSPSPVKTFTIGFDDAHVNELKYARIAARHFGTDHTEEILRPDMVDIAPKLAGHFGQPFADSSALPTWLVSKLARAQVTVALSGDGGDELFAGYTWLHRTRQAAQWRRVPDPWRRLARMALRLAPDGPRVGKLRRFVEDSFLPLHAVFRRRITCFTEEQRADLYAPDLALGVAADAIDRFQEYATTAGACSDDDRMLSQDLRMYLPDDILTKVDHMSMAHALEVRVPILDHRIVEFAASVPFDLKLRGRISKLLVKRAFAGMLPPALLAQRKQGFGVPIHRWFRRELKGPFEELVLGERARNRQHLQSKALRALFDNHVKGRENYGHHLWAIFMFEHWLRYLETIPGAGF